MALPPTVDGRKACSEHVVALIRGDKRLTEAQKAALLAVYDGTLRE